MRVFTIWISIGIAIGLAGLTTLSFLMGQRWASQASHPGPATAAVLAEPNELLRAAGLVPILSSLRAEQLDAIVGAYEATFDGMGPGSVAPELLGEAWARLDPVGALRRITGWEPSWRRLALPAFLQSWARRDPQAARSAVAALESPQLRSAAIPAVIRGWAESDDPDLWSNYVAGLPFGEEAAGEIFEGVAAREGVHGLLQRVEALPDGNALSDGTGQGFKRRAMQLSVQLAASSDPEEAAAFVERQAGSPHAGDPKSLQSLQYLLAAGWVTSDGPRAMAWVLAQPPDAGRDWAFRLAFYKWLRLDREAAVTWASAQDDPTLAPVLDFYAQAIAETDPERGIEIAEGIGDPETRQEVLVEIDRIRARETNGD